MCVFTYDVAEAHASLCRGRVGHAREIGNTSGESGIRAVPIAPGTLVAKRAASIDTVKREVAGLVRSVPVGHVEAPEFSADRLLLSLRGYAPRGDGEQRGGSEERERGTHVVIQWPQT